jgi:uncharacterized membrane protein YjfL (UPF0719 family)
MEQLIQLIPISNDLAIYLAIDIAIAIIMLLAIRSLSGFFSKVSVSKELGEKDNFAFGISLAGRMVSLTIVLSAVVGRHIGMGYDKAATGMLLFGGVGIVLVKIGRIAHDKFILNRLDKNKMIDEKNVSVALVDACSAIAIAIITKSIIEWSIGSDMNTFIAVFSGVLVVLSVLLVATRVYEFRFAERNQNSGFQRTLCNGQIALAIQHGGNLIGIAIAVSSASKVLIYSPTTYVTNMTGWLIASFTFAAALMVLTSIAKRVVLTGVKWRREVALQHNIGIASICAALSIGIGLLFNSIF